jgi:hypothetical protein
MVKKGIRKFSQERLCLLTYLMGDPIQALCWNYCCSGFIFAILAYDS